MGEWMYRSTFSWQWHVAGERSALRPGRFTTGERAPGTQWIGGWMGPRTGLDDVRRRKFLILPGLELRTLRRPASNQLLYRLGYPGSYNTFGTLRSFGSKYRNRYKNGTENHNTHTAEAECRTVFSLRGFQPIKTVRNAAHWNRRRRILLDGDLTASIDIRWLWTAAMASAPVDASNIPATTSLCPLTGIA
jgi:hypothetical protein